MFLDQAAAQRGLPVAIHRVSSVTENEDGGAVAHKPKITDVMANAASFSLLLGVVPDGARANWRGTIDFSSVGRMAEGALQAAGLSAGRKGTAGPGEGQVLFEFQSGQELLSVTDIAKYVTRKLGRSQEQVGIFNVEEWAARAVKVGMDEFVAVFLCQAREIVFQELIKG